MHPCIYASFGCKFYESKGCRFCESKGCRLLVTLTFGSSVTLQLCFAKLPYLCMLCMHPSDAKHAKQWVGSAKAKDAGSVLCKVTCCILCFRRTEGCMESITFGCGACSIAGKLQRMHGCMVVQVLRALHAFYASFRCKGCKACIYLTYACFACILRMQSMQSNG